MRRLDLTLTHSVSRDHLQTAAILEEDRPCTLVWGDAHALARDDAAGRGVYAELLCYVLDDGSERHFFGDSNHFEGQFGVAGKCDFEGDLLV